MRTPSESLQGCSELDADTVCNLSFSLPTDGQLNTHDVFIPPHRQLRPFTSKYLPSLSLAIRPCSHHPKAMDDLVIRRMFVVPSFEIHGGVKGLYDYGPPGCGLKSNITALWKRHFILAEGMLEMECTNLTPKVVLETSGEQRFGVHRISMQLFVLTLFFPATKQVEHGDTDSCKRVRSKHRSWRRDGSTNVPNAIGANLPKTPRLPAALVYCLHRAASVSGHVDKFTDLMVKDTVTGVPTRADHLLEGLIDKLIAENPTMPKVIEIPHDSNWLIKVEGFHSNADRLRRLSARYV